MAFPDLSRDSELSILNTADVDKVWHDTLLSLPS
jgi:hypothetical protein